MPVDIITNLTRFLIDHLNPANLPESKPHEPLPLTAVSPQEFYERYQPLIIEEVLASVRDAVNKGAAKSRYRIHVSAEDNYKYLRIDDITIITLRNPSAKPRIACTDDIGGFRFIASELLLGRVSFLAVMDIFDTETKIICKGDFTEVLDQPGAHFDVIPLLSLTNLDRMYTVCTEMPLFSLLEQLQNAEATPWSTELPIENLPDLPALRALNPSQAEAVTKFVSSREGLYLLQGPPGTGKTTTIVALLQTLVAKREQVLVCAPSNKAVQILAERALAAMPEASLLLVGVDSKIPERLQAIAFDNWQQRYRNKILDLITKLNPTGAFSATSGVTQSGPYRNLRFKDLAEQLQQCLHCCLRYLPDFRSLNVDQKIADYLAPLRRLYTAHVPEDFPTLQQAAAGAALDTGEIMRELTKAYQALYQTASEVYQQLNHPKVLINNAQIVFCTLSTAGRPSLKYWCSNKVFDRLIIDEAGQAVAAEALIGFALAADAGSALLVGDTRQLPATTISPQSKDSHFEWSLLWHLIEAHRQPSLLLSIQYRMAPEIEHYPNHRYYGGGLIGHASIVERPRAHGHFIPPHGYKVWVDHTGREELQQKSYCNREEAIAICNVVAAIEQQDRHSSIGIICFYSAQTRLIKQLLKNKGIDHPNLTISSVDGFQGDERDIILISLVRANPHGHMGFLWDYRRLNVALTRARKGLIVCGSAATFARDQASGSELQALLHHCQQRKTVQPLFKTLQQINRIMPVNPAATALPTVSSIPNPTQTQRPIHSARPRSIPQPKPASPYELYTDSEMRAQAQRHIDQDQFAKALEWYQALIERNPNQTDLYPYLAHCHEQLGNEEQASLLRELAKLPANLADMEGVESKSDRMNADPLLATSALAANGGWTTVTADKSRFKKRLEAARKGTVGNDRTQLARAEAQYLALRDDAPNDSEVLLGLGWCLHKQQKHTEAEKEFTRSLALNRDPLAYQGLIQCKTYQNQWSEALDLACQAFDFFPWSKSIARLKELCETKLAQLASKTRLPVGIKPSMSSQQPHRPVSAAGAAAPAPAHLPPPAPRAQPAFAFAPSSQRHPPQTTEISKAELAIGQELRNDRRYEDAENHYRTLLKRSPRHPEVLVGLGFVLHNRRCNDEAIPYFEKALENKRSYSAYFGLVLAYYYSDNFAKARQYGEACLKEFPDHKGKLTELLQKLDQRQQRHFRHAAVIQPHHAARSSQHRVPAALQRSL